MIGVSAHWITNSAAYEVRYVPQPVTRYRVAWDDEVYGTCRTQLAGYVGPVAPPAVFRFAPEALPSAQKIGDYRVDISVWKAFFLGLNGGDLQDFEYWSSPLRAQFNGTGWAKLAYLVMSGNRLNVLQEVGDWVQFETLKPGDLTRAAGMTKDTHPHLVHRFTCVKWDGAKTVHIESTGTPRGQIYFPLISKEGYGYIPSRNVVKE
jgi:hypothetical protein